LTFKYFAEQITLLPDWCPTYASARSMESLSILGPFFSRTSIFPDSDPNLAPRYFGSNGLSPDELLNPESSGYGSRNQGDVKSAQHSLRDVSALVQTNLHGLMLTLIKSGPVAKDNVLSYFASVIKANMKRGMIQVNRAEVSTDGFMHNILQVSKILCEPLMDPFYSKIGLIDNSYFLRSERFDFSDETRINADKDVTAEIAQKWKEQNPNPPPLNFVTEIFFMTIIYHHYGLLSTIRFYNNFLKELEEMQKQGAKHFQARLTGQWDSLNPVVRASHEQGLNRFLEEYDKLLGVRIAMEGAIMDSVMLEQSVRFYNLVMMWLIKCATGAPGNIQYNRLAQGESFGYEISVANIFDSLQMFPFPVDNSEIFKTLPEWIIDDICDFYTFIMRYKAPMFENNPRDEFITFSMVMLQNSASIKNPYLKSKLVEVSYLVIEF
jgi:ubiquitin conjugation factor E4 B